MSNLERDIKRNSTGSVNLQLPELFGGQVTLKEYGEDIVVHARDLNHKKFDQILTLIPASIRKNVIGFVSIGRSDAIGFKHSKECISQ